MDRGSDRLALITGRFQTVPPFTSSSSSTSDPQPRTQDAEPSDGRLWDPQSHAAADKTTGTSISISLYIYVYVSSHYACVI